MTSPNRTGRLAICAILKNEASIIREWLAYHRVRGVEKFFLYDNNSTDNTHDLLAPFIAAGLVEYRRWPINPGQLEAYEHYINTHMGEFEWTAFIDLDEFLCLSGAGSIADWLDSQPVAAGVAVHWLNFGPAGQDEPPPGLMTIAYDRRLPVESPVHAHIKTIVRTSTYRSAYTPHAFELVGPVVNERGEVVNGHRGDYSLLHNWSHDIVWINHYYTRSRREWREKVARGMADSAVDAPNRRLLEWWDHYERDAVVEDGRMRAFAAEVERELNSFPASGNVPAIVSATVEVTDLEGDLVIETAHGTVLAMDRIGQLSQISPSGDRGMTILRASGPDALQAALLRRLAGARIVGLGERSFAVERNGRYLCALNDGNLVLNRENVAAWEIFAVREIAA